MLSELTNCVSVLFGSMDSGWMNLLSAEWNTKDMETLSVRKTVLWTPACTWAGGLLYVLTRGEILQLDARETFLLGLLCRDRLPIFQKSAHSWWHYQGSQSEINASVFLIHVYFFQYLQGCIFLFCFNPTGCKIPFPLPYPRFEIIVTVSAGFFQYFLPARAWLKLNP